MLVILPRSRSLAYSSGILITLSGFRNCMRRRAKSSSNGVERKRLKASLLDVSARRLLLVDISIPVADEALIVLRRIDLVNDGRIVHRNGHNFSLVLMLDRPGALLGRVRILQQLPK